MSFLHRFQRITLLCSASLLLSCGTSPEPASEPAAGTGETFAPLMARGLSNWVVENGEEESFRYEDGVLTVTGNSGWLRSPRQYVNFILRFDVRFVEPDADSGVFIRAGLDTPFILGWPGDSYQVQMRDISVNPGDNPLPLAQVYRHVVPEGQTVYSGDIVRDSYTGAGEWQQVEITVIGTNLTVRLNGRQVTVAQQLDNAVGHIGFQSERGTVQYRNIEVHEF